MKQDAIWNELFTRYPALTACRESLLTAADALIRCYEAGGKLLLCGNGGSCADCDHISGELMKGFLKKRPLSPAQREAMRAACPSLTDHTLNHLQQGLPAIPLAAMAALSSAYGNDVDPELTYAQLVLALGKPGDVLVGISTSGNARNVAEAARVARGLGITVIGLTGGTGGSLAGLSDVAIVAPDSVTFRIQELHLPIYHALCAAVEAHFYDL